MTPDTSPAPFMKTTIRYTLVIMGLLLLVTGCKPSNRITFKPINVSVDPGEGWKRLDLSPAPPVCSPTLIGKAGMINALALDEFTDDQKAADFLRGRFASNADAVADSFKQEEFSSDSGLHGIHLSYTDKKDTRSHSFVTHNMVGKCVSISYITSTTVESPAVLEAIRKTLRVE